MEDMALERREGIPGQRTKRAKGQRWHQTLGGDRRFLLMIPDKSTTKQANDQAQDSKILYFLAILFRNQL